MFQIAIAQPAKDLLLVVYMVCSNYLSSLPEATRLRTEQLLPIPTVKDVGSNKSTCFLCFFFFFFDIAVVKQTQSMLVFHLRHLLEK